MKRIADHGFLDTLFGPFFDSIAYVLAVYRDQVLRTSEYQKKHGYDNSDAEKCLREPWLYRVMPERHIKRYENLARPSFSHELGL